MNSKCFIGIDVGAESGRVMAGTWDGARMQIEELHRFPNAGVAVGETLRWDMLRLVAEIETGLCIAGRRFGGNIVSVGVDTWGVDFVLLSKTDEPLGWPRHYRDPRNPAAYASLLKQLPREEIFAASGIQFMPINTLCQLVAMQSENPELLDGAAHFLMVPDFIHWSLCGSHAVEFTNATTTQFYHPTEKRWSSEILAKLGIQTKMLPEVVAPGTDLGAMTRELCRRTRLASPRVVAPATHDTGSAIAAVPTARTGQGNWAYISSGTWSLLGVELPRPILSARALEMNITNEGGVDGSYRVLKNIMGLWLVQRCRLSFETSGAAFRYDELTLRADAAPAFRSFIDPDDSSFLNPPDMPAAIADYCARTGQPAPENEGQFVRCILESLALKYATVLDALKEMTGNWCEMIHIVGGGSRNTLLNQFAANACRRAVLAGPAEATVLGNVLVQARTANELGSLEDIRRASWGSSAVVEYLPSDQPAWKAAHGEFARILERSARRGTAEAGV